MRAQPPAPEPQLPRRAPVGTGTWLNPAPRGTGGVDITPGSHHRQSAGQPTGSDSRENKHPDQVAREQTAAKGPKPATVCRVHSCAGDWTQDGGFADAVLSRNRATFWESDETESDPAVPWINIMFSAIDIVTGVWVRFDPADGAPDIDVLPQEVEVQSGVSDRTTRRIHRVKIDQNSTKLQPLLPDEAALEAMGAKEERAVRKHLQKEVFIIKLLFHGLREEQEGHVRVRQIRVKSEGMNVKKPEEGEEERKVWPSGRTTPSESHSDVVAPWNDK